MNKVKRHIPSFCSAIPKEEENFSNLDELFSIEWISIWTRVNNFYRFSKSKDLLIAELNKGNNWWVIGYIKYPELVDLPEWIPIWE